MTRYFAAVFVAISTLFATTLGTAFAKDRPPAAEHSELAGWAGETGKASYYGPAYHGHLAASGVRFDQEALTAAHPWLPFGTKVKVSLPDTGRTVVVTITDRLNCRRRIVDLSLAAARVLGMVHRGVAEVTLVPA